MEYHTTSFEDGSVLEQTALDQSRYFFRVCDADHKGFITKRDMQRLKNEFTNLTEEQLEDVFDSLDRDGNGRLTVDEFVHGFGAFLGLQMPEEDGIRPSEPGNLLDEMRASSLDMHEPQPLAEEQFHAFLDNIGGEEIFRDQTSAKTLWMKMRKDQPQLLSNFETFLSKVTCELQQKTEDFSALESIFKQRCATHDGEIRKLYDEMEGQIRSEKERIAVEERQKAEKMKEDMERELTEKDRLVQELVARHAEIEKKYERLSEGRTQTEQEKEALRKEREDFFRAKQAMEADLTGARHAIAAQREQLEQLKKQTKEERRERAKAAFKVTEGIASEREGLVKQLETLRHVNKKLTDERDEMRTLATPIVPPPIQQMRKHQSVTETSSDVEWDSAQQLERFKGVSSVHARFASFDGHAFQRLSNHGSFATEGEVDEEDGEDQLPKCLRQPEMHTHSSYGHLPNSLLNELDEALSGRPPIPPAMTEMPIPERVEPLGGNETMNGFSARPLQKNDYREQHTPDRIFKVVFVGDSGVGKTCFLYRFCHDTFRPTFSATIGVDFQVKTLLVDDRIIALQLWDTAGQERFRSITKQYFRKADGVVLMYDVTSELSFLNLRNWMQSVKEGVEEDCVLCLIGNKIDLCSSEDTRVIKYRDGQKLAADFGALFFETSSQTGASIHVCMQTLAMSLREREDQHLEKVLNLEMEVQPRRRACCGGKK